MKNVLAIVAFILLFLLLTWSALRSMNAEAASAEAALRQLDIFAATESAVHRDMLRARAGLLRNYDPLVREVDRLGKIIADLSAIKPADTGYRREVDRLGDIVAQQERWLEEFKSRNALLQNSLAYFNVFNTRLRQTASNSELMLRASAVATTLLRLTTESSQDALHEFDDRLNALTDKRMLDPLPPQDREVAEALIAHARLLRDVLPATDRIVKATLAIPSRLQQDRLRNMVIAREAASERHVEIYRRIVYGIAVILIVLTVGLTLRLQSWARTLRRIARIEHVIADISTRFIKVQPDDLAGEFEHALKALAGCINADRAYFVRVNEREHCYRWSRSGIAWPPHWTDDAMSRAIALGGIDGGIIYRPVVHPEDATGMPPDVRGWLCVPHLHNGRAVGILAFDSVTEGFKARLVECRLFRTACDALANAVFREALLSEQRRLESTLQQVRRLDTIGAFASGIAHNFNNIVGAILGYVEMAQLQGESGKVPAGHLLEIKRAGERARDLVDQILKFGRQTAATDGEISLANLLSETGSLLSASLPPHIAFTVDQGEGDNAVRGQSEQLQQVLLNVCNNAAQAIEGAGAISITVRRTSLEVPTQLDHGTLDAGRYVVIAVADTGRGMSDATRNHMFDPFFTTRADGNGLGLATVREIVLSHGGGVTVRSGRGAGTCLEIWLPCVDLRCLSPGVPAAEKQHEGGETVFLFDADAERLLRHEEIIAALGYEPVGFVDSAAAIEALRASPERFDVAVVCHVHGTAGALGVARALSTIAPATPIVLATASAGDLAARILATIGVSEVLGYPLRAGEVASALARCLASAPRCERLSVSQRYA